jgi:hypothetical protein
MSVFSKNLFFVILLFAAVLSVSAQSDNDLGVPASGRRERKEDLPPSFKEMLSKQRVEKEKKDHEELLRRGDEAVELTEQLDEAFQRNNGLSNREQEKLETLEKLVTKIRKELGGDDDDGSVDEAVLKERRPSSLQEAFSSLKETTVELVKELQKTTRFSISAMAIQSSNTVLRLVRFLKFRK